MKNQKSSKIRYFFYVFAISVILIISGCSSSRDYGENDDEYTSSSSSGNTSSQILDRYEYLKAFYSDANKVNDYVYVTYNYVTGYKGKDLGEAIVGGFVVAYKSNYYAEYIAVGIAHGSGKGTIYRVKTSDFTYLLHKIITPEEFAIRVEKIEMSY
ncbi:MAG: hypothetical protein NTU73_15115 [Ignavibacteriae bacterium]|nr:hypothetical protein [Ignavibacteriota bacterium]